MSPQTTSTGKGLLVAGWIAVAINVLSGYLWWTVPDSWYTFRDYAAPIIALALCAFAIWVAVKFKSWALGILAVLSLASPFVIILGFLLADGGI